MPIWILRRLEKRDRNNLGCARGRAGIGDTHQEDAGTRSAQIRNPGIVLLVSRVMESPEFTPNEPPGKERVRLPETEKSPVAKPSIRSIRWAQTLILVAVYSVPALICVRMGTIADLDLWWHLRSAEWITQHGALPQTDPFSAVVGRPWVAYSWLFELMVFQLFRWFGLAGAVIYSTVMVASTTVLMHRMTRRLQIDFSMGALLALTASLCLVRLYSPRSWWFTILFFVLEIDLLLQARKNGKQRRLMWLPVIFALWANLHILFVYGLLVLALALAETVLARWWKGIEVRTRSGWLAGIFAASLLATLANPYGWKIYQVAYGLAGQSGALDKVGELSALPFRRIDDWGALLLVLAATGVLARTRRFAFFESVLLAIAIYISFRSQRDVWVVVIAASAILAEGLKGDEKNRSALTAWATPFVAVGAGFLVWLGFWTMQVNNTQLRTTLAENMPVRAVEVVREKGWTGPLYNDYNWGGYLIWALRIPVSIDGRQNIYGDEWIDRSNSTWTGQPGWDSDPDLAKAGLVIGPVKLPLTQLLRMDPRFQLVYEDKLAAVFVARRNLISTAATAPAAESATATHDSVK